jgi:hypothetical protein
LDSGVPIEIRKSGKLLRIVAVEKSNKLKNLISRPDVIKGNPDELVSLSWEKEVNLDLH